MNSFKIAVIPGDGIGKEVIPEGILALEAAGRKHNVNFEWTEFDWSCETYHNTGRMMPDDGLDQLRDFDAIYLGAVGFPGVPDHISLWGLLIPIRRTFRPVRQPASGAPLRGRALPAGRQAAGRHRLPGRARERRGRVLVHRRHPV